MQTAAIVDLGGKATQQDAVLSCNNLATLKNGTPVHLFGVFDGHGTEGGKASQYVVDNFPLVLKNMLELVEADPKSACIQAFAKIHALLAESQEIDTYMSGTTGAILLILAVVVLIVGSLVHCAHVGDSRMLVCRKAWKEDCVTGYFSIYHRDHTCEIKSERERIESMGGRVDYLFDPSQSHAGTMPYPGIVVSRSLGDRCASKLGVSHIPEVRSFELQPTDKYLLLATDGLWDALSPSEVNFIAIAAEDANEAASLVMKKAIVELSKKQLDDNIAILVIRP